MGSPSASGQQHCLTLGRQCSDNAGDTAHRLGLFQATEFFHEEITFESVDNYEIWNIHHFENMVPRRDCDMLPWCVCVFVHDIESKGSSLVQSLKISFWESFVPENVQLQVGFSHRVYPFGMVK